MKIPSNRRNEGVLRKDAGTVDREGFIAPTIGVMEHALYFTTAPSVLDKARQVISEHRLELPGVVVVWDETIGRRKGSKAVPNSWWAEAGSLTAAFVFPTRAGPGRQDVIRHTAVAVIRALGSFQPNAPVEFKEPNDLYVGDRKIGALFAETHEDADLAIVRLNCCNDLSRAPAHIAAIGGRFVDYIDVQQLPLKTGRTLPNTLLTRLMTEMPAEFAGLGCDGTGG